MQNLSRRERQIMDLLFQHGEMTAREVQDKLDDPPGYATVRSLLRILEDKGQLTHFKAGRQFVYRPTTSPDRAKRKSLNHLLKTFFSGSISEAVATFVNQPEQDISPEELEELEAIIRNAKNKKG